MERSLGFLVCIFFFAFSICLADLELSGIEWSYLATVQPYADMSFFWTAESTTLGDDDYSLGDMSASLASAATINSDDVYYGTNSLSVPSGSDYAKFTYNVHLMISGSKGSIGFWWKTGNFTHATNIFRAYAESGQEMQIQMGSNGGNAIRFYWDDADSSTGYSWAGDYIVNDTWYYINITYDVSTDECTLSINGDDKGSGALSGADSMVFTELFVGTIGGASLSMHYDNVTIEKNAITDMYTTYATLEVSPK